MDPESTAELDKMTPAPLNEPPAIAALPRQGAYPVPWFVATVNGGPDFRVMDPVKLRRAVVEHRCWLCGRLIVGRVAVFVVGPMCAVNRTSSEPPSHRVCAEYAVTVCPFLTDPNRVRRQTRLPEECHDPAGVMITRNPGVTLLWVSDNWSLFHVDNGVLFDIGDPRQTAWYCQGRAATATEVRESLTSGLPALVDAAARDGEAELADLDRRLSFVNTLIPDNPPA